MPPSLSRPLSFLIHSKTGGVALFIVDWLKSLHEKGLVRFSVNSCRWEFDHYKISHEKIPGDIVEHLGERIKRLPESVQAGLEIAACLGTSFDIETFTKAQTSSRLELDDFLTTVVEGGFIQEHYSAPGQYTWNHDKIREAAYGLIPSEKLKPLHLLIGTRLFLKTNPDEVHHIIHDIARNMNIGKEHLGERDQRIELAHVSCMSTLSIFCDAETQSSFFPSRTAESTCRGKIY